MDQAVEEIAISPTPELSSELEKTEIELAQKRGCASSLSLLRGNDCRRMRLTMMATRAPPATQSNHFR